MAGPNDATLEDMWRLIHDSGTSTIVMLTNPVEATKVRLPVQSALCCVKLSIVDCW